MTIMHASRHVKPKRCADWLGDCCRRRRVCSSGLLVGDHSVVRVVLVVVVVIGCGARASSMNILCVGVDSTGLGP